MKETEWKDGNCIHLLIPKWFIRLIASDSQNDTYDHFEYECNCGSWLWLKVKVTSQLTHSGFVVWQLSAGWKCCFCLTHSSTSPSSKYEHSPSSYCITWNPPFAPINITTTTRGHHQIININIDYTKLFPQMNFSDSFFFLRYGEFGKYIV